MKNRYHGTPFQLRHGAFRLLLSSIAVALIFVAACGPAKSSESNILSKESAATARVTSVKFNAMPAPSAPEKMVVAYSSATVTVTRSDGSSQTYPLGFNPLFYTGDTIGGNVAGGVVDINGNPVRDDSVAGASNQFVSDTPDGNSLLQAGDSLFLVTHYEYVTEDNSGTSRYGRLPASMSLATLSQNGSGALSAVGLKNIDMTSVGGLWIPCASSLSPWNSHLGSEEYEPDARMVEAGDPNGWTGLDIMESMQIFNPDATINPYNYGVTPEIYVSPDGTTSVRKQYAMGRIAREKNKVMPDKRTVYMGDDGAYVGLFMFIADRAGDLSSGTLYAAIWNQTSSTNGGSARLTWIKLGHGESAQIEALADKLKFSDIFSAADTAPTSGSYVKIKSNNNSSKAGKAVEWLELKSGMENAAAFLETRRYAGYLGATLEFNKMEGVTLNSADKKLYIAMSRIRKGMKTSSSDPADHIRLAEVRSGGVYELALGDNVKDTSGGVINSNWVATEMHGLILGEDTDADVFGNTSNLDKIANPDNLSFSEGMRTLFIGEDSGRHVNNFLWAFNVDSGDLARILSLPAGAESTGLQVVDSLNGYAYIMSNYQHPGDFIKSMADNYKSAATSLMLESGLVIPVLADQTKHRPAKGGIGYLGGLPAIE